MRLFLNSTGLLQSYQFVVYLTAAKQNGKCLMQKHGSLLGKILNLRRTRKSNEKFMIRLPNVIQSQTSLKTIKLPSHNSVLSDFVISS